ncbi:Serine/threonine-protein kinase [Quillaja saponaria]|uniref:Serine/threonine-protein kinase n=1 Tax=Quillaja saponaria TaxID=32244 RepID=A0AAD7QD30_QUISA|nr:Serine/threonine-protein kinase [Quillaja saponaria]
MDHQNSRTGREREGRKEGDNLFGEKVLERGEREVVSMENHKDVEEEEAKVREDGDEVGPMVGEEEDEGDLGSSLTLETVAAAKQFNENHYKAPRKHIQER